MISESSLTYKLKRGLILGGRCAAVTFLMLFLLRENLTIGIATAAPVVILIYFVLGRFFLVSLSQEM